MTTTTPSQTVPQSGIFPIAPASRRLTGRLALWMALCLVWQTGCPSTPNPKFRQEDLPMDLGADKGQVGLATTESLLHGPRARGRTGDWVVRNDRVVAILRRQDGKLIDLADRRTRQDVFAGLTNTVSDTRGTYAVFYSQAKPVHVMVEPKGDFGRDSAPPDRDGRTDKKQKVPGVEFYGRVRDKDLNLEVKTTVWALPDKPVIAMRTTVRNASSLPVVRVGIGDRTYFGNEPVFVPGFGIVQRSIRLHAAWVARDNPLHTLALVARPGVPMALRFRVYSKGFSPGIEAVYRYADLKNNERFSATRYLVLDKGGLVRTSGLIQHLLGGPLCRSKLQLPTKTSKGISGLRLQVERQGRPVLDAAITDRSSTFTLSAGKARARLWMPGVGTGPWVEVACNGKTSPPIPAYGTMRFMVTDAKTAAPMPARVLFRGTDGTKTPDFGWQDRLSGTVNQVYTISGKGRVLLAPGTYLVAALHGPEYAWNVEKVTIRSGAEQSLHFTLQRVIDSKGALSADLHLHAVPSADSELSLETRLAQLAATGVEIAVATDHNAVTDYRPALSRSKLSGRMFVSSGVEATTKRSLLGHFNIFPLRPGSPPPPYENRTAKQFFSAWRNLPGRPILQVNHPRLTYLGYFNQADFDPRLGRAFVSSFSDDFDALEVFNGTRMHNPGRIEDVLADWFALLNLGRKITGTGNSDSHKLVYQEAGYPRNYILAFVDEPSGLTQKALVEALRKHRLVAGSGPYLSLSRKGTSVVGAMLKGPVTLEVGIQAPCHLSADRLALVANGRVIQRWVLEPTRLRTTCKDACDSKGPTAGSRHAAGLGLDRPAPRPMAVGPCAAQKLSLPLTLSPKRDTWYLLVAWSTKDNPTLPVPGGLVMSFTNPVWVDADGNGKFDPPGTKPEPVR